MTRPRDTLIKQSIGPLSAQGNTNIQKQYGGDNGDDDSDGGNSFPHSNFHLILLSTLPSDLFSTFPTFPISLVFPLLTF